MYLWAELLFTLLAFNGLAAAFVHRRRFTIAPAPQGPPIFRESSASGREVTLRLNRMRTAYGCLSVAVYDDQIRFGLPVWCEFLWPLELSLGMPRSISRDRLHGAYALGDQVVLEYADHLGQERGVELRLKRTSGFLAAIQS